MMTSLISGCSQQSSSPTSSGQPSEKQSSEKLYTAGTYIGEGKGNNGPIKVEVTFS